MCRFNNVCLNHTSKDVQYYVGSAAGSLPLFYDHNATPHFSFPPDFVSTGVESLQRDSATCRPSAAMLCTHVSDPAYHEGRGF